MYLSFGRCGTVEKAWPECLEEGTFSELWPMRVVGKLGRQQRNAELQTRLKPYVALSVAWFASLPPRSTGVGSLLLPVRDAAAFLAHPAHAPVLGDHYLHRSGQRASQPIGRAVASTYIPSPLFDDLLTFEVQSSPHNIDGREPT